MGVLITPGGRTATGGNAYAGECHLWVAESHSSECCWPMRENDAGLPLRVVVDLGTGSDPRRYKNAGHASLNAARFDPDILILTHSDADHIGGYPDFMAHSDDRQSRLAELWVPYEWGLLAQALAGWFSNHPVSHDPDRTRTTPDDIASIAPQRRRGPVLIPAVTKANNAAVRRGPADENWLWLGPLTECLPLVQDDGQALANAIAEAIRTERARNSAWTRRTRPERVESVAADVVKKVIRLVGILVAAARRDIWIRYFSTDAVGSDPTWNRVGRPGGVTVINAEEVCLASAVQVEPGVLMYRIATLTAQNRRALAPFLWDRGCGSCAAVPAAIRHSATQHGAKPWGALIWSDGGGESCLVGAGPAGAAGFHEDLVPWEHVSLMTAPHHGSANPAHDRIWESHDWYMDIEQRRIPVLLAGGDQKNTTEWFTRYLPSEFRACQRCRHLGDTASKSVTAVLDGQSVMLSPTCPK